MFMADNVPSITTSRSYVGDWVPPRWFGLRIKSCFYFDWSIHVNTDSPAIPIPPLSTAYQTIFKSLTLPSSHSTTAFPR
jgi:hypothetical protein